MRALVIDVNSLDPKIIEASYSAESFQRFTKCKEPSITLQNIGGKLFRITFDKKGYSKGLYPTGFNTEKEPMLFGNLAITNFFFVGDHVEDEDAAMSLSNDDIMRIVKNLVVVKAKGKRERWLALKRLDGRPRL